MGSVDDILFGDAGDTWAVLLPVLVVFLSALSIAALLWPVLIEHRRPWPFDPRGPFPNSFWRETAAAIVVAAVARIITSNWWEATRLYQLEDDRLLWVAVPAGFAAQFVAWCAVFAITYVLAHLVVTRTSATRHRTAPEALPGH